MIGKMRLYKNVLFSRSSAIEGINLGLRELYTIIRSMSSRRKEELEEIKERV
jgi:hypothetical protein